MKNSYEKFIKRTFTTLLIVHLSFFSFAATYYISTAGNNGNNGSLGSPWRTLNYACAHATTSGDIIHVNAGTYLVTSVSNLATGVSIEGDGINSIIKSHVGGTNEFNFTISLSSNTEGTNGNQHISNLKMDGDALTACSAIRVLCRSNVEIYNCTFINFNYGGVAFDGNSGRIQPTTYSVGNKFHDNIVTNCAGYFPAGVASGDGKPNLAINGQQTMLIYNNTMTQTSRPDGNNGYLIKGVSGYNKDIKIFYNTLTKKAYNGTGDIWDFAIELWYSQGGIEIYGNNTTGSIDLDNSSKGIYDYSVWIHDNTIGQQSLNYYECTNGILLEVDESDVIIERNYIHDVTSGVYFQEGGGSKTVSNIRISDNIIENIGCSGYDWKGYGIKFEDNQGGDDIANNINFWNNTIISATAKITMYGIKLPDIGTATNISVRNNIVKGFSYAPVLGNGASGVSIDVLSIENNIFYGNGNSNNVLYSNNLVPSHNTTQNNLISDPLFVSTSDFQLQAGSPAINAGLNVGLSTDFIKNSIIGLPDIGVYEYNPASFTKGINLSGSAVTIDGNTWTSYVDALAQGMNVGSAISYGINVNFMPTPVNGDFSNMLNGILCSPANSNLNVSVPINNGTYRIYLWMIENYADNSRGETLVLEGNTIPGEVGSMLLNTWTKYGPYEVTVTDGDLNIDLETAGGWALLSGIAIYSTSGQNKSAHIGTNVVGNLTDPLTIDVFPNPCASKVTVRFSTIPISGSRIDILDISGRKVASRIITNTLEEFNLDQLSPGIYLVKSIIDSKETFNKLIINK